MMSVFTGRSPLRISLNFPSLLPRRDGDGAGTGRDSLLFPLPRGVTGSRKSLSPHTQRPLWRETMARPRQAGSSRSSDCKPICKPLRLNLCLIEHAFVNETVWSAPKCEILEMPLTQPYPLFHVSSRGNYSGGERGVDRAIGDFKVMKDLRENR